jgi:hypothetical protein
MSDDFQSGPVSPEDWSADAFRDHSDLFAINGAAQL